MSPFKIPKPIEENMAKLNELVEKYPLNLPLPVVAEFMATDADCLRAALDAGTCPFGYGWKRVGASVRAYKIPTTTFWFWYTHSNCVMEMESR